MRHILSTLFCALLCVSSNADAGEDPRLTQDASVMATVCGIYGCREMHVMGPYITELYGRVDKQQTYQWHMDGNRCNAFLLSPLRHAEVQAWLAARISRSDRVIDIHCSPSYELSI